MATWTDVDVDILEGILLRAKSEALSERGELARLGTAYHDRQGIQSRLDDLTMRIALVGRLLTLTDSLRPATMGDSSNAS